MRALVRVMIETRSEPEVLVALADALCPRAGTRTSSRVVHNRGVLSWTPLITAVVSEREGEYTERNWSNERERLQPAPQS